MRPTEDLWISNNLEICIKNSFINKISYTFNKKLL